MDEQTNTLGSLYYLIPSEIMHSKELNSNQKLIYALLCSLADKNGVCQKSDQWIGEVVGRGVRAIQRKLKHLQDLGLITRDTRRCPDNPLRKDRSIFVNAYLQKDLQRELP